MRIRTCGGMIKPVDIGRLERYYIVRHICVYFDLNGRLTNDIQKTRSDEGDRAVQGENKQQGSGRLGIRSNRVFILNKNINVEWKDG
jgi:hypothetical protein